MSRRLTVVVTDVAKAQIVTVARWWRLNRPKAPDAIREELERASSLIAAQPGVGSSARDSDLAGVRRLHLARVRYDIYYRVEGDPERVEVRRSGTPAAAVAPCCSASPRRRRCTSATACFVPEKSRRSRLSGVTAVWQAVTVSGGRQLSRVVENPTTSVLSGSPGLAVANGL
jgi:plasmid stabilization system protein ParE